jgi:DNA polymerase-3 subunit gamma/tau
MSYQVIARKWRPQRFDDVVGQQAVTRTLRNALVSGRLAQAFVFAGPRGVGKTTTARILARALNCVTGPTADPCGVCDACVEIAEGRDIDVLEIDAATHTQVDNVREVIIAGLGIVPVRNRYKVFIIDEVHQLSASSFNALLKSIEEPPPHVVFMMATTELHKIPETVLSRSQVYEFRTIGSRAITTQLRKIADAEGIEVADASLQLIARDADGSMRDAQSKLDQVIAFTGKKIDIDDVSTVLGLVGRDLVLDAVAAVAQDDARAAFVLAARAVELGYDLRRVCAELLRAVRDLLVLSVDPSRADDPEIAGEGEKDRLVDLARQFSREDLLRAFELLTRAEADIRVVSQPRYHFEMVLLKWIYLRKLVPIEDLIAGAAPANPVRTASAPAARLAAPAPPARSTAAAAPVRSSAPAGPARTVETASVRQGESVRSAAPLTASVPSVSTAATAGPRVSSAPEPADSRPSGTKGAFLAEIRKSKVVFYNTVVAQAQAIEFGSDRVTFTFSPNQRTLRDMLEQNRGWLEALARQFGGPATAVVSVQLDSVASSSAASDTAPSEDRKTTLREQALADAGVQALLDVFPAEIRDVEEI